MTKLLVNLTDRQRKYLEREAKRLGASMAEVLRRLLDAHMEPEK